MDVARSGRAVSNWSTMKIRTAKIHQLILGNGYFLALSLCFLHVVVPRFNFGGFQYHEGGPLIGGILLLSGAAICLPSSIRYPSQLYAWLSFLLLICPSIVLSVFSDMSLGWVALIVAATYFSYGISRTVSGAFYGEAADFSSEAAIGIRTYPVLVLVLLLLALLVYQVGGPKLITLSQVYDYRFKFNSSIRFPMNYLFQYLSSGLLCLFVVSAALLRKYHLVILSLSLSILIYLISSHKSVVGYPLVSLLMVRLLQERRATLVLQWAFLAIAGAALLPLFSDSLAPLGTVIANRLLFIPAEIHSNYFQIFSEVGYQYWSGSKLGFGLYQSDLPLPAVNYVAFIMTGYSNVSANTGWVANGFMNGGFVGVLFYAAVFGGLLAVLDVLANKRGCSLVTATFASQLLALTISNDLFVGLLTGGFILTLATMIVVTRDRSPAPTGNWGRVVGGSC